MASLGEVAWEESWEELMARADHALYEQKSSRRAEKLAHAAEVFFQTWDDAPPQSNVISLERETASKALDPAASS